MILLDWPFNPDNVVYVTGWSFWMAASGLIITTVGFSYTIFQLFKAKTTAEEVENELERVRQSLVQYDAAKEIGAAQYALATARRYLAKSIWDEVAESYDDVRRSIIKISDQSKIIDPAILEEMESALIYIERFQERVEAQLESGTVKISIAKTRSSIRSHRDLLNKIHILLEKDMFDG